MQNNGFTLIESIIILYILSIFTFSFSFKINSQFILNHNMNIIKSYILQAKHEALLYRKNKNVTINGNYLNIDGKSIKFNNIYCDSYTFSINQRGNVNKAGTIQCSCNDVSKDLIIHLGSGDFYIR